MPRSSLSLFSGCGGMDAGLHAAGFLPLACFEIDQHAAATLKRWLREQSIKSSTYSDVAAMSPNELRARLGLRRGELELLVGGPPCQPFSLMGNRRSVADDRGALLFQMTRYARAFEPRAILIEQVRGLLSAPDHDGQRGGVFQRLVQSLEDLGYSVASRLLCAADYGVPQVRHRLFIVALAGATFQFPAPTHCAPGQQLSLEHLAPYLTVENAIGTLPEPVDRIDQAVLANHVDITPLRDRERIQGVPAGDYLARQTHLPADQRLRLDPKKDTTKFRRLAWDQPSLTLRCGEVFYHPIANRYLTPRECARLHGFDDDHVLVGPIRGRTGSPRGLDQHRLVANAVPPPLAKVVGDAISSQAY